MNPCTPEQAAGADLAIRKAMGQHIPDEDVQAHMPVASQITYSKHTGTAQDHMATDLIDTDTHLPASVVGKALRKIGAVDSYLNLTLDSQEYLGHHYTKPLLDALQKFNEDKIAGKAGFEEYKNQVTPIVERLQSMVQDRFEGDNARINYANQWLDYWHQGGKFYAERHNAALDTLDKVLKPVNTAIANLVGNNPFIAIAHTFQVTPKGVAIYGPKATLEGMLKWSQAVGQSKTIHIPELLDKGAIYAPEQGIKGALTSGLTTAGDNIGRGLSYYIADTAKAGTGMEGVHNIAFGYQLGREPMINWYKPGAAQVALMRYGISGAKMYGGWLRNLYDGARTGDVKLAAKGASALASFTIAQSLFTGVKSAIPAPAYGLLDQDTKDLVDQLDEALPGNWVQKLTGRDIGQHYQPLQPIGLGVGADIVNQDFKGAYRDVKKTIADVQEGDITRASVDFVKSSLTLGQPLVPGLRLTYKKLFDVVGDTITGDLAPEDVPEETAKKLHFPAMGAG